MKVLVIGSGGREHALCFGIAASPQIEKVYCAPGNPGVAEIAECVSIKANQIAELVQFAEEKEIDLVVVGPDDTVVAGIADELAVAGIPCFGPSRVAAQLEGSKAFAKDFLLEAGIPTAGYHRFDEFSDCERHLLSRTAYPVAVKASGLAAGKGVVIAQNAEEAVHASRSWMVDHTLGNAGSVLVIEDFLVGEEMSLFVVSDGMSYQILPPVQDHKQLLENDRGPNTGGMGTCAPSPALTDLRLRKVHERIVEPTFTQLNQRGTPFIGVLFIGLMFVGDEPYVLEYNVRFGDPETQALVPLLNCDLLELLNAAATGELAELQAKHHWSNGNWRALAKPNHTSICVTLAARGYPSSPEAGAVISVPELMEEQMLFQAGVKRNENGEITTAGGRVMYAVATGDTLHAAWENAYQLARTVRFQGKHYRKDIGHKMFSAMMPNDERVFGAQLIILGSSSGMPAKTRATSCYWLEKGDRAYLMDVGEGCSRQMLRFGCQHEKLQAIFISHTHPDHCSGLPMLLQMLKLEQRRQPLAIYFPSGKSAIFENLLQELYILPDRLSFDINLYEFGSEPFDDGVLHLDTFATEHLRRYREVAEPLNIATTSLGFRIRVDERLLVYPSDIPDLQSIGSYLSAADLLLIEATHIPVTETAVFAAKHRIPRVVLTHIKAEDEAKLSQWLHLGVEHGLPSWQIAEDGMTITF